MVVAAKASHQASDHSHVHGSRTPSAFSNATANYFLFAPHAVSLFSLFLFCFCDGTRQAAGDAHPAKYLYQCLGKKRCLRPLQELGENSENRNSLFFGRNDVHFMTVFCIWTEKHTSYFCQTYMLSPVRNVHCLGVPIIAIALFDALTFR
jgi:hypothetical protein